MLLALKKERVNFKVVVRTPPKQLCRRLKPRDH
jgi:hypothetical protein